MKEKILEMLKTKFNGVSEQTLNRMADKAAKTVTDEDGATTYVDGLVFQSVIDSEADYRATKATQTSIENYEKKHNLKEGKPLESKKEPEPKKEEPPKNDEIPDWGKSVLDFINTMSQKEKQNALKEKKAKIVAKLIELGADEKDKPNLETLVDVSGVPEDADVDEKSNAILSIYNALKKPSSTPPPSKPDEGVDDSYMDKLLKQVKTE